jgi:selenobiotic family peptide radical SAM maturase
MATIERLLEIYPCCLSFIGPGKFNTFIERYKESDPKALQNALEEDHTLPPFLSELARLEWALYEVSNTSVAIPRDIDKICINPTFQILQMSWKNLESLLGQENSSPIEPEQGKEIVFIWKDPKSNTTKVRRASDEELLILKIIVEGINPEKVAEEGNLPIGAIDRALDRTILKGILLSPKSRIKRDPSIFTVATRDEKRFLSSQSFTLQWHVTQACDLHCRHCYDRSTRTHMEFDQALMILDDLRSFCRNNYVRGAISFTGGNPFLYPNFIELYREASDRGFALSILGNPVPRETLEHVLIIQKPTHFQVSLEGLPEHNDYIRGLGHFSRIIEFLKVLRDLKIFSMVMLTLTKENMHQILPLAEVLRDHADRFHFNRLSMVGEGSDLTLPARDNYIAFLESYVKATDHNPILGFKDNLINILRHKKGMKPFGGCTGYGCGAAFNFLAALPDGEVHACRKLPSRIGNLFKESIEDIYNSAMANRYRSGSSACKSCTIRPVCGGCLASAYSHGLNIFEEKDPFCFMDISL